MRYGCITMMTAAFLFFTACSKKSGSPLSGSDTLVTAPLTNPIGTTKPHGGNCCLASNTDDATKSIEVYDPADEVWTQAGKGPNRHGSDPEHAGYVSWRV